MNIIAFFLGSQFITANQKTKVARLQIKLNITDFIQENFSEYFIITDSIRKTKISQAITYVFHSPKNNGNRYRSNGSVIQEHNTHVRIILLRVCLSLEKKDINNQSNNVSKNIVNR